MPIDVVIYPDVWNPAARPPVKDVEVEFFRGREKIGQIRVVEVTERTVLIELNVRGEKKVMTWEANGNDS